MARCKRAFSNPIGKDVNLAVSNSASALNRVRRVSATLPSAATLQEPPLLQISPDKSDAKKHAGARTYLTPACGRVGY